MDYSQQKLIARVNRPDQANRYRWLVIDYDEDYTRGFYLFICGKDPDDVLVDHWFKTEAEAKNFAHLQLNVSDKDWEATKRTLDLLKTRSTEA